MVRHSQVVHFQSTRANNGATAFVRHDFKASGPICMTFSVLQRRFVPNTWRHLAKVSNQDFAFVDCYGNLKLFKHNVWSRTVNRLLEKINSSSVSKDRKIEAVTAVASSGSRAMGGAQKHMKLFVAHKMTQNSTLNKIPVIATELQQLLLGLQNTNMLGEVTAQLSCDTWQTRQTTLPRVNAHETEWWSS